MHQSEPMVMHAAAVFLQSLCENQRALLLTACHELSPGSCVGEAMHNIGISLVHSPLLEKLLPYSGKLSRDLWLLECEVKFIHLARFSYWWAWQLSVPARLQPRTKFDWTAFVHYSKHTSACPALIWELVKLLSREFYLLPAHLASSQSSGIGVLGISTKQCS